jgi:hypothetical protein
MAVQFYRISQLMMKQYQYVDLDISFVLLFQAISKQNLRQGGAVHKFFNISVGLFRRLQLSCAVCAMLLLSSYDSSIAVILTDENTGYILLPDWH